MTMPTAALILALIATVQSASADSTVFKCKTEQGVVYQRSPCAEQAQQVKSWPLSAQADAAKTIVLEQDPSGHYFLASDVNGHAVTFIIDTGASLVSLPQAVATAARLSCKQEILLQTANGTTTACTTVIDQLKLGGFSIRKIDALIIPNLEQPLLGMNVLQRFVISQEGSRMAISEP